MVLVGIPPHSYAMRTRARPTHESLALSEESPGFGLVLRDRGVRATVSMRTRHALLVWAGGRAWCEVAWRLA